jgi:hypothetical protein
MKRNEGLAYLLTPTDVARIRELLTMFSGAVDRIFDRTETDLHPDFDEIMEDIDFQIKCSRLPEVDLDLG